MKHALSKLKDKTVVSVEVAFRSYGLPSEVIITASDGYVYRIDNLGLDGGECGHYPGMNFSRVKKDTE